jgi:hypothetical protein
MTTLATNKVSLSYKPAQVTLLEMTQLASRQESKMFRQLRRFHPEEMVLAIILWMCSLPLVALLVIPFFGLKAAAVVALVLFLVAMVVCWGICGWQIFKE